jgi:hypothetical protein
VKKGVEIMFKKNKIVGSSSKSWRNIKKELANILTLERYAFMFELIISKGFSGEVPGKLSIAEKERLQNAINSARHGNISGIDALPEPQDQTAVNRIANWLSWIYSEELSLTSLSAVSILGDSSTVRSINEIYKGYNILKKSDRNIETQDSRDNRDLREIMATYNKNLWADMTSFCIGFIVICNQTLNIEDAWIIPNVIGEFHYHGDLGMIHIPKLDMAILQRTSPGFSALSKTTCDKVDLAFLAKSIRNAGWKVKTFN